MSVCWWKVRLLVGSRVAGDFSPPNSAGETRTRTQWRFAGQTHFAAQTRFAGTNTNIRPNADCRPNTRFQPQREFPAGRELPPKQNLLARTQFAGTKNKVTEFFLLGPLFTMVFYGFDRGFMWSGPGQSGWVDRPLWYSQSWIILALFWSSKNLELRMSLFS